MDIRSSFRTLVFSADFGELPNSVLVDIFHYVMDGADVAPSKADSEKIDQWLAERKKPA